jgi:Ni2+-binding GTPase involved in maturation of urease and hydrogenase
MAKALGTDTVQETILDLVRRVEKLLARQVGNPCQRILVGLAGVPGSGKSTVSDALIAELVRRGVQDVAVVPMVSLVDTWTTSSVLTMFCRTVFTIPSKHCQLSRMPTKLFEDVERPSRLMRMRLFNLLTL